MCLFVSGWTDLARTSFSFIFLNDGWRVTPHLIYDWLPEKERQWRHQCLSRKFRCFNWKGSERPHEKGGVLYVQCFFSACCHIHSFLIGNNWKQILVLRKKTHYVNNAKHFDNVYLNSPNLVKLACFQVSAWCWLNANKITRSSFTHMLAQATI